MLSALQKHLSKHILTSLRLLLHGCLQGVLHGVPHNNSFLSPASPEQPGNGSADSAAAHLDASVAQELLHAVPGGVGLAHELEHALKHVSDGIRRRLQGSDLIQMVRPDLAHSQTSSLNDWGDHG